MELKEILSEYTRQYESVECIYDELSTLDFSKPIIEQENKLDEDLFQLSFNNGKVIDIGWYPAFEVEGEFIIQVIVNENWEEPTFKSSSTWDKNELIGKINTAINNCS